MKLIQSRDNALFKQLKKLAESGRERRKSGLTLLDGVHLVQAYEEAFGRLDTLIVAESASGEAADYAAGREHVVLADALMRDLGLVETPSGLLAMAPIPAAREGIRRDRDAILLDGVQDPGNLGTLLRTAAAAGIRQAVLSPGCASAWAPKVLRAGQGAHFALSIHEDVDLLTVMADYAGTTAVTCLDGATSLYEAAWSGPVAWVFGAEGQGVGRQLIEAARLRVRIPMPGGVESLNVAAAAAVCLFEAVRRRLR
ncbi:TrmH family RNA methyltransferase [Dechloromonas sp. ARDL1]|uniref:TrmH family RNA methyltransferase n=1 Tax=Dechloromonas sp. ARDL1 TaxID=3322121 RepID=UPI003DA776EF